MGECVQKPASEAVQFPGATMGHVCCLKDLFQIPKHQVLGSQAPLRFKRWRILGAVNPEFRRHYSQKQHSPSTENTVHSNPEDSASF